MSSVQSLSCVQLFATPWLQHARPPCPSPTPGVHSNPCLLSQWCHPTISFSVDPSPPTFNLPQHQGLFKWVSSSHQLAKVLGFQLQYQSFQWTPRTDFLWDGLVGSPCSPRDSQESSFEHHSSKVSILQHSAFFIVQLSHPSMTTEKTTALTRPTFVGKVMSLLFNMLSRLVITFLPRSKHLNFMAAVTICSNFGAQENKVCHCFHCFPTYLPWSDMTRCHDLSFLNVEF